MGEWSLRKRARNQELVKFVENNPGWTWDQIGAAFGISRQRAYQIWKVEAAKTGESATGEASSREANKRNGPSQRKDRQTRDAIPGDVRHIISQYTRVRE